MLGLRVRGRGVPPVEMGLAQDRYLVSATVSVNRRSPRHRTRLAFVGLGIDDRHDHLGWFRIEDPSEPRRLDIQVAELSSVTSPRRRPRPRPRAERFDERLRASDMARVERLRVLRQRLRQGSKPTAWPTEAPSLALQVTVNGVELGRVGIREPGSLSVTVYAKRRDGRSGARLDIHGLERVGESTWHALRWPKRFERRLERGDRVRIQVVPPQGLVRRRVREVLEPEPTDLDGVRRELAMVRRRLRSAYYRREAELIERYDREREPPRRYPRSSNA